MNSRPVFSVVIPSHNYARYLREALDSVLNQGRDDVQVILVDDASQDETPRIAGEYGDRIRYLRNPRNLGAGGAWRVGLAHAVGDYLIKLDADDRLLPDHLTRCEAAFRMDPNIGTVIASVLLLKERQRVVEKQLITDVDTTLGADEFRRHLLQSFFFRMPGCVLRRSIIDNHEPPDPDLYQIHDWEFFLRVTKGHRARLLHAPGGVYRIHDASITATAQFNNRLFDDICRWTSIAAQPGERFLEAKERRILLGSCAELLLIGFGPKFDPRSYARYAYKYYKAFGLARRAGWDQVARMHRALFRKIVRKFPGTGRLERVESIL